MTFAPEALARCVFVIDESLDVAAGERHWGTREIATIEEFYNIGPLD